MRQQMMLSLHGRPSDVDGFRYFLAMKLGKTVAEMDLMPVAEYEGWQAYLEAYGSFTNQKRGI